VFRLTGHRLCAAVAIRIGTQNRRNKPERNVEFGQFDMG